MGWKSLKVKPIDWDKVQEAFTAEFTSIGLPEESALFYDKDTNADRLYISLAAAARMPLILALYPWQDCAQPPKGTVGVLVSNYAPPLEALAVRSITR